jgi:hypothetical protein
MDKEIDKPVMKDPTFFDEPYDYRNIETPGKFRGVGERGKTGTYKSTSMDAMSPTPNTRFVPRDHKG